MSNLKVCGTALAALMISAVPALALDGDQDGRPRLVLVEIDDRDGDTTNLFIELRRRVAVRVCGDDFSRSDDVACTISESEAEEWGFLNDGDSGDDDDNRHDANRGHGNDPDGFDEDNPGRGHGKNGVGGGNGRGNGNGNNGNRGGGN